MKYGMKLAGIVDIGTDSGYKNFKLIFPVMHKTGSHPTDTEHTKGTPIRNVFEDINQIIDYFDGTISNHYQLFIIDELSLKINFKSGESFQTDISNSYICLYISVPEEYYKYALYELMLDIGVNCMSCSLIRDFVYKIKSSKSSKVPYPVSVETPEQLYNYIEDYFLDPGEELQVFDTLDIISTCTESRLPNNSDIYCDIMDNIREQLTTMTPYERKCYNIDDFSKMGFKKFVRLLFDLNNNYKLDLEYMGDIEALIVFACTYSDITNNAPKLKDKVTGTDFVQNIIFQEELEHEQQFRGKKKRYRY